MTGTVRTGGVGESRALPGDSPRARRADACWPSPLPQAAGGSPLRAPTWHRPAR